MVKISISTLLVAFLCIQYAACEDDDNHNGGLGTGQHFPYELTRWHGKEQLVTKLEKAGEVYEFVRVSKEEFQVRQASDAAEVFFKFNTGYRDGGVILENGRLVDLLKTQETVAALMYGDGGYFLIEASKKAPELKKGQIYIIGNPVRVQNWHRTFLARSRDYYLDLAEVRYPLSDKVASTRLLESRKIEFFHRDKSGKEGTSDVFFYREGALFKNSKKLVKNAVVTDCISNEKSWLSDLESALHDKNERTELLKDYYKDDLLSAFSNASDKQIHAKLVALVDELYGETKK